MHSTHGHLRAPGSAVNLIDPDTGALETEPLGSFLFSLEAATAAGWPEFVQFP